MEIVLEVYKNLPSKNIAGKKWPLEFVAGVNLP